MSFAVASRQLAEKASSHSAPRKTQTSRATAGKYFDSNSAISWAADLPEPAHAPQYGHHFGSIKIFPKLAVTDAHDPYEREADRVAEHVMSTTEPELLLERTAAPSGGSLQRKCASCEEEEERKVRRKASDGGTNPVPPIVEDVLRSPGQALDPSVRAFMEPRFGHDFATVRVHTDERAASSARAINALAYTAGQNIVLGSGQYSPGSSSGRRLLAHELAHVVQQDNQPQVPAGTVRRAPTPTDEKKRIEEHERQHAEESKKAAVAHHRKQQERVILFLDDALDIKPDLSKGPLDPDNLFHNTAELLAGKPPKMVLAVLSPTHYSDVMNPIYFDERVKHPNIGGDYPADPKKRDFGMVTPPAAGAVGQTLPFGESKRPSLSTLPPKVEAGEGAAPAKPDTPTVIEWLPAKVRLFTGTTPITQGELKNVFVHEGQHVADWNYLKEAKSTDWRSVLELYKSEFRAFWLQPPIPREHELDIIRGVRFPDPDPLKASEKQSDITISGKGCDACGGAIPAPKAGKAAPTKQTPKMKNKRQEAIFRHLIELYPADQFDCFYVCNEGFRDEVNKFDLPASTNLVNSARLIDVSIELQKLKPTTTRDEVAKTKLLDFIEALDAIDWAFLRDVKFSAPFWESVKIFAPPSLQEAFETLAKKKVAPDAAEIKKALEKAVAKLKP